MAWSTLPEVTVSLHGTLETFALSDVMALLSATKKTGELRVVGGRLDGRVHLNGGLVVSVEVGRADSYVDAVFELLRLTSGKFSFDADKQAASAGEPAEVEPLLAEAQARLAEWREIEAVVPSLEAGVHLVASLSDPHVTLASEQWHMVVAVASARTVQDVADALDLGEYAVSKALKELVEAGVVEMGPAPVAEPDVEAEAEVEAEEGAETAVEAEVDAPEAAGEPEVEPEPEPESGPAVSVAPLVSTPGGPPPPGEEPAAPKGKKTAANADEAEAEAPKAGKPKAGEPAEAVSAAQAKQLVSQLAALSAEAKPAKPAKAKPEPEPASEPASEAKAPKADAKADAKAKDAPEASDAAEQAGTGEGGEEPLNRGLLLKFLSSVRQ
ncbi:MAG TPA: DUF4388 domain-containing protein [Acidimicrobiales bacterium]|nr:DUF4388 domain-containing protein [Acidimicrobiales bacterium]